MILKSVLISLVIIDYLIILSGKFHLQCVTLNYYSKSVTINLLSNMYLLNAMLYMHVCGYVYVHVCIPSV